jgi:hypothetical protein
MERYGTTPALILSIVLFIKICISYAFCNSNIGSDREVRYHYNQLSQHSLDNNNIRRLAVDRHSQLLSFSQYNMRLMAEPTSSGDIEVIDEIGKQLDELILFNSDTTQLEALSTMLGERMLTLQHLPKTYQAKYRVKLTKRERIKRWFATKQQQSTTQQQSQDVVVLEDKEIPNNGTAVVQKEEQTVLQNSDDATFINRQIKAADNVNLSGTWRPIVSSTFKEEYDEYLKNCSESYMFRKVVVNGIKLQKEIIRQINDGADLEIIATNPVGNWNRTLYASPASNPINTTVVDPDGDSTLVEAWWEEGGTKHKSLLQGKPRVKGGVFETVRYLESDNVLVCNSSFIPSISSSTNFKYGNIVWKFQRDE